MKLFVSDKEKRTIIITEDQAENIADSGDNWENLSTFKERVEYCTRHFGNYIGCGSSRVVFQMDDETVLKLAFNDAGVEQNKEETKWANGQYSFLPKIHDYDSDGSWIMCEYVLPAERADFDYYFNKHLDNECKSMVYNRPEFTEFVRSVEATVKNISWQFFSNEKIARLRKNPFLNEVATYIETTKMSCGDLTTTNNWGLAKRNGDAMPVLLDSGWRNGMYDEFYRGAGPKCIDDVLESKRTIVLSQNQVDDLRK